MTTQSRQFPSMPPIGKAESYYTKLAEQAENAGDAHARAAAKVGLYVTLALTPGLAWEEKAKYFHHALKRHCTPPPFSVDDSSGFYQQLAELVRQYAGQEALRIASEQDDLWAARMSLGQTREGIEDEAESFFGRLLGQGDRCPEYLVEGDWLQIKLIRDQWM